MGFNFRKSFSLGNGVRVTVGKKSASVSVGRKGVRGSISTTGRATGTVSIPGTGLSYSTSKKVSDLIPGGKDKEEKKTTAKKTSSKTAAAKKPAAKTTAAKTAAKKPVAKAPAKAAAEKPEPAAETAQTSPSNPFSTGKAKKMSED